MSTTQIVHRDERTIAVETASYRWAYLVLSFGLLGLDAYRSFVHHESSWDMLGLVVLGGVVSTAYQGFHGMLSRGWVIACLLTVATSAVLAEVIAWIQ
jgi:hypothetical protein